MNYFGLGLVVVLDFGLADMNFLLGLVCFYMNSLNKMDLFAVAVGVFRFVFWNVDFQYFLIFEL